MSGQLMRFVEEVRASFWFVPTILATAAVLLSLVTVSLDQVGTSEWLGSLGFIYLNQPGGARSLLSTIAGSMMNVAGVVFSLTIVALTLASQQFGPRLLGNFMRDRGNQTVLGIFVATFLYSLLVLRTVRSASEDSQAFVPHLSVTVALLLTLITLGATIYFIHHVAQSIQVHTVIHKVASAIAAQIGTHGNHHLFPEQLGEPLQSVDTLPGDFRARAKLVTTESSGYFQAIDTKGLLRLAHEHDAIIELLHRPGPYLMRGQEIALVYAPERPKEPAGKLHQYLSLGSSRTQAQDLESLFDQLLELALRSLSPSTNDPITATACIDRIVDGLLQLDQRSQPSPYRADDEGRLRVIVPALRATELAARLFSLLRSPVSGDLLASEHMLNALETLRHQSVHDELAQVAQQQSNDLLLVCEERMQTADYRSLLESLESQRQQRTTRLGRSSKRS